MRDYSKVSPRFWTGSTGREIRKLGPQTQVIAFYLFTGPHANMLGLYYLGFPTLCHETGSPFKGASKALRSLQSINFAYFDEPSETVYLPNMAREQIGYQLKRKDNRHIALLRELEQYRKTPYFNDFVTRYREAFELQDVVLQPISESPLEAPSKGLGKPLRSQEQEQEQEQEQKSKSQRPALASRLPSDFSLTPERIKIAEKEHLDPERTFAKFTDHWKAASGAKARKLDWDATWRNWCRNETDRKPAINGNGHAADFATQVWLKLLATDGSEPHRTPAIQAAIEAAGGWSAIRERNNFTVSKLKQAFCDALRTGDA